VIHCYVGGAIAWPIEGLSQQASRTHRVAYLAWLAQTSTFIKERFKELDTRRRKPDFRCALRSRATRNLATCIRAGQEHPMYHYWFRNGDCKAAKSPPELFRCSAMWRSDRIWCCPKLEPPRPNVQDRRASRRAQWQAARVAQPVRSGHPHCRCARGASRTVTMVALPQLRKAAEAVPALAICDAQAQVN